MALEIERKFLTTSDAWKAEAGDGVLFRQGYMTSGADKASVRVRIEGERARLNIKSVTVGNSRLEYEYDIPVTDAEEMLEKLCNKPLIEKHRYFVKRHSQTLELDEFLGDNAGLVVAEVELDHANQVVDLPDWIGREVTEDTRYYNACLVNNPFKSWR